MTKSGRFGIGSVQIQDHPLKIVDNYLRFRPEVTFDKTGVRSSYDDGSSTFFAWNDICKIELLSVTQQGSRRGRFFLFWGPEDKTVLVPYDQAPLVAVQESRWLPGFNIQKLMSLPNPLRTNGDVRATFWERPSDAAASGY
jgi:hypothetical protein